MTPIGIKLWYADGTKLSIAVADLAAQWPSVRATGVQALAVFFAETYQIWLQDGGDAQGQPINQRLVTQNYRAFFCSGVVGTVALATGAGSKREGQADYYWFDPARHEVGGGLVGDVPADLPAGVVKTGSLLSDERFRAIYTVAVEDRNF